MTGTERIYSIDIMRGLNIILILFVNDLYMSGVQSWMSHMDRGFYGMNLANWIFPGILFIVGMSIPHSINRRISEGQDNFVISRHIFIRTISLFIIGVLIFNSGRVNPELTGFGRNLWAGLMYLGVFLTWNDYVENERNYFTITGLKLAGMALLAFLIFKFKSGEAENEGSLIIGGWGILGSIGWGYLVAAFVYLGTRDNILNTVIALLFFLSLNILSELNLMSSVDIAKPIFGVILEGNVPMLVLSGMLVTLVLRKYPGVNNLKPIIIIIGLGFLNFAVGLAFHNWLMMFNAVASLNLGLICIGINMILFALLYLIEKRLTGWTFFIKTAGENALTTCILSGIIYCLIGISGIPVLIYKQPDEPIFIIAGSFLWALLMAGLTVILVKRGIRLKI